jgi:ribosomal protein S18 acetylase RimI-like enzyme
VRSRGSIRGLGLRPAGADDEGFLFEVYASTRTEELAPLPWDDAQKDSFLRQQFAAQHEYYREQFPDADFLVIVREKRPVGRLYVHRRQDEIRLVDVALLPQHRNEGIGSFLVEELLDEAARADKPVRIHVEKTNPALRLYERLGFTAIADRGVYALMEWRPSS